MHRKYNMRIKGTNMNDQVIATIAYVDARGKLVVVHEQQMELQLARDIRDALSLRSRALSLYCD